MWLRLLEVDPLSPLAAERERLIVEAEELKRIISAIANRADTSPKIR